jgi:5'-methylthioadenosine phosphorylase
MSDRIGIIGGSGLYDLAGLKDTKWTAVATPFGDPSDELLTGRLGETELVFLPRHGRGHRVLPHEINFRANLWAMKKLGVTRVISVSAVGSMKEQIEPGHLVVPDQFIDRTHGRVSTFFGEGIVGHVSFGDPTCPELAKVLYEAARASSGTTVHKGGSYLCINGPQFSTRAESHSYRALGVSVIGMTNMPEAKLAREAELCYATLALSTDYDCWHEGEAPVTVEAVMAVMAKNIEAAKKTVAAAAPKADRRGSAATCGCGASLKFAVMTDPARIPKATREKLSLLVGKYLPPL